MTIPEGGKGGLLEGWTMATKFQKKMRDLRREMIGKIPEDSNDEIWAEIPGYEGAYAASTLGRVYSIARVVPWYGSTRLIGGDFLRRSKHTGQYHLSLENETLMVQPSTAILMTFMRLGAENEVAVVIDKSIGPRLGNVEWRDNADFCVQKFERTYGAAAKITASQLGEIFASDLSSRSKKLEVAQKYGLSVSHIYRLLRGENQITVRK